MHHDKPCENTRYRTGPSPSTRTERCGEARPLDPAFTALVSDDLALLREVLPRVCAVFYAVFYGPRQYGSNEKINGLLRQYFTKGTRLSRWTAQVIQAAVHALNIRSSKTLAWKAPTGALNAY